jgi:hypothetical protein
MPLPSPDSIGLQSPKPSYNNLLVADRKQYDSFFAQEAPSKGRRLFTPKTADLFHETFTAYAPTRKIDEQFLEGTWDMSVARYATTNPEVILSVIYTGDNWPDIGQPNIPGPIRRHTDKVIFSWVKIKPENLTKLEGEWSPVDPNNTDQYNGGKPGAMLPDITKGDFDLEYTLGLLDIIVPEEK